MTREALRAVLALGLGALLSVGCVGPDSGRPAPSSLEPEVCPAVPSPCGGELVGKWEVVDTCMTMPETELDAACPGSLGTIISSEGVGGQEFFADGTTVSTGSVELTVRYDMPLSCLPGTCAQYGRLLQDRLRVTFQVTEPVLCEETADTCICSVGAKLAVPQSVDTFAVDDTQVTTVDAAGEVNVEDYCVEGDRATFVSEDTIIVLQRK